MRECKRDERACTIGANIRKYRLLKELTQDELAEGICSASQLSKAETGKALLRPDVLKAIAERLGVTPEYLEMPDRFSDELQEWLDLARGAWASGQMDKADELIQRAIEGSRMTGEYDLLGHAVTLKCYILTQRREFEAILELVRKTLDECRGLSANQKVMLYVELGDACRHMGRTGEAYDWFYRADEEYAHFDGDPSLRAKVLFALARSHYRICNGRTALRYAEQAEQLATELSIHIGRVRSASLKAIILAELGEYERAEQTYLALLKETQDNSLLLDVGIAKSNYASLLKRQGKMGQAKVQAAKAIQMLELVDGEPYCCESNLILAEIAIEERDYQKARQHLEVVLEIAERLGGAVQVRKAQACRVFGRLEKARGRFEPYVTRLQESQQLYAQQGVLQRAYEVAAELACELYERGDARAVEVYRQAIAYNEDYLRLEQT